VTPSVVQGLVSCTKCGYALYRTSTRSSARKIHYYRCLGSDTYRHLSGPVCNNRPIRQDLLDDVVWTEIVRLLEDPRLIQNELERRLMAAREADPTKRRDEALRRDLVRIRKGIDRLLSAYKEGLLPIEELRERMPQLRRREQAGNAEPQAIADRSVTRAAYLRLAETLNTFLTRLRSSAGALDVLERQRIMRLVVKEVLVGDDKIIIRHCIPLPDRSGDGRPDGGINAAPPGTEGYLCVRGAMSPLLSNLMLDVLDKELEKRGHHFVRYADDCNIYVRSQRASERVMAGIEQFLAKRLKLKVNKAKSAVAAPRARKFLGFNFTIGKSVKRRLATQTVAPIKEKVRVLTRRTRGRSLAQIIEELARYLTGWRAYFGFCETPSVLRELDQWIRRRLRAVAWKQWKRGRTRFAELTSRGVDRDLAA
jgi:hypothetical protein